MPVDIDISHVARLARLRLSPEELETYGRQCRDLLEHVARIQAVDTGGVEPTSHPLPMTNRFREDRVTPDTVLDREEVLGQAPNAEAEFFRVPLAIEDA
ncbi:MAG: Asp-tRNA(Asn)/Glu-tRNA(Gln) amidotransferase subunit GatC [bacterium]|nr:Asp-tRNA(Asn)/Glu-tRNA(Gln) amidotransferase subunit GatC [bacterium]